MRSGVRIARSHAGHYIEPAAQQTVVAHQPVRSVTSLPVARLCTIVDAHYLPRLLVLHRSLQRAAFAAHLYVLCMDETSESLLHGLALQGVVPMAVGDLEVRDSEFRQVKPNRTRTEYCWTAKPVLCLDLLEREGLDEVIFVDADLVFFSNPVPILDEFANASVLITPHRYSDERRDFADTWGTYNSQLVAVRRDANGLRALRWWRQRCLEWCHELPEPGLYSDQKHMDDWPQRFEGVRVLENEAAGVAPWNSRRYRLEAAAHGPLVDGRPLVFYHCASLQLIAGLTFAPRAGPLIRVTYYSHITLRTDGSPIVWRTTYALSKPERVIIWGPYVREVATAIAELRRLDGTFTAGVERVRLHDEVRVRGRQAAAQVLRAVVRLRSGS